MNTPNPLVPQGSQLEQKSTARSRVKLAVFFVLSIHVVGLMALLVQGCRPEQQEVVEQPVPPPDLPVFDPVLMAPDTNEVLLAVVDEPPPNDGGWGDPGMGATLPPVDPATGSAVVAPPPPHVTRPVLQEYIVQKGDTYYSMSKKFGVTMQAIADANPGVDPKRLQVGKTVVIPPPVPVAPTAPTPTAASGETLYTVVSGDTLSSIAAKYRTTWQAIRDYNALRTTSIKVGQVLKIPAPKPATGGTGNGGM